jgi:hypothetical protein
MLSRPKRVCCPPKKWGFNVETDDSEDGAEESTKSDDSASDSGSDSDSIGDSNSDSDSSNPIEEDISEWTFVYPGNDPGPPLLGPPVIKGWQCNMEGSVLSDYLSTFLPDTLFECLARWTNSRALIENAIQIAEKSEELKWKEVDAGTMKKFFGLTLLMGMIKKPEIRDYWATDLLMSSPFFHHEQSLSRNRYLEILRFIRFSDPLQSDPAVKMSRVQDMLQIVHDICALYVPTAILSIDETLLLFKGRLSFKIFIRTKRARFGLKSFVLADADGYMIFSHPYIGSDTDMLLADELNVSRFQLSKSERIVVYLLEKTQLLDKGYVVNADNWFCSLRLAQYLFSRHTGLRGTVRVCRGVPHELKNKKVQPGGSVFIRKKEVLVTKFVDKRDVYLLSTVDSAAVQDVERFLRGGYTESLKKPTAILKYNLEMAGIDKSDQILAPYSITRKSHVWFKKLGFNLLQRLLVNSFIRFRNDNDENIDFKEFTKEAIIHFTGIPSHPMKSGRILKRRRYQSPVDVSVPAHVMQRIPATEGKRIPTRKCRMCTRRNKRRESRYQCITCPWQPALCMGDCFAQYHA